MQTTRRDLLRAGVAAVAGGALDEAAPGTPPAQKLASPVGHYHPELLLLAPESGEDANTRSLLAQFLELGVPVELDARWRLPAVPPRDLSAYKACIFPESARARYDADLDAFYRRGGYLGYFKYYPLAEGDGSGVHHYLVSYGRDAYFYHVANVLLEGGLTVGDPDFGRALAARPVASIVADCRESFFARYGARSLGRWESWGDTAYTYLIANHLLAARLGDRPWQDLVRYCLTKVHESAPEAARGTFSETRALADSPSIGIPMMGEVLMRFGAEEKVPEFVESGLGLVRSFVERAGQIDGVLSSAYMRLFWSETLMPVPALYWASRVSGEQRFAALADRMVRAVTASNQRADGLWHHWTDKRGRKGACWSRGSSWPALAMTRALAAAGADSEAARFMRATLARTEAGLARYQDGGGLWRLVVDEPATRLETSAASALLYCHDRLRELSAVDGRRDAGFERAFAGLKRLHYRGGLAASCRGTATGAAEYYRTRPLGYYDLGLFAAALAPRLGQP